MSEDKIEVKNEEVDPNQTIAETAIKYVEAIKILKGIEQQPPPEDYEARKLLVIQHAIARFNVTELLGDLMNLVR